MPVISRITCLILMISALAGCNVSAPAIGEGYLPSDTTDAFGPYLALVKTWGPVDSVTIEWTIDDDEDAPKSRISMTEVRPNTWEGAIPGSASGTSITLSIVAKGPGGTARFPRLSDHRFTILDGPQGCGLGPACPLNTECVDGQCRTRPDCEVDEDCRSNERCEGGTCVPTDPCPGGCPPGQFCVEGVCRDDVDCRSNDECPDGFYCDNGTCLPRADICSSVLCETGTYCHPDTGECVECRGDNECEGEQNICLDGFCADARCGDDLLEPNNDVSTASPIEPDLIFEGVLCATDADVFRLTDSDTIVGIEASQVGLDVVVIDENEMLQLDESINNAEGIEFIAQAGWYVIVSTSRRSQIGYVLKTEQRPANECIDDRFEDNNVREEASRLGATGAYVSGVSCPNNDDWFRFRRRQTSAPTEILVKGGIQDFKGDLENSDGDELGQFLPRGIQQSPYSSLIYEGDERDIFFRLSCPDCDEGVSYTLATRNPRERCNEDGFEPNDNPLDAVPIPDSPGFQIDGLIACANNDDFFLFENSSGLSRTLTVTFNNARGDIDIGILDEDAMLIEYQLDRGDGHSASLEPGTYYLRVMLFGAREATYSVRVDETE